MATRLFVLPEGIFEIDDATCPVTIPNFEESDERVFAQDCVRFLDGCIEHLGTDIQAVAIVRETRDAIQRYLDGEATEAEVDETSKRMFKASQDCARRAESSNN